MADRVLSNDLLLGTKLCRPVRFELPGHAQDDHSGCTCAHRCIIWSTFSVKMNGRSLGDSVLYSQAKRMLRCNVISWIMHDLQVGRSTPTQVCRWEVAPSACHQSSGAEEILTFSPLVRCNVTQCTFPILDALSMANIVPSAVSAMVSAWIIDEDDLVAQV